MKRNPVQSVLELTRSFPALILAVVLFAGLWPTQQVSAKDLKSTRPEAVGMSSSRLKRLSTVLTRYVENEKLPGGVVLIARRGKIVYQQAFGQRDREAKESMEMDVIFRIASQTKALVSVGIMMLQERGQLLITDPLGKYLPAFQNTSVAIASDNGYEVVPAKRPITIRDLLTHTSGIDYGAGIAGDKWRAAKISGWYFADRDEPIAATITRMASLPFQAQPGAQWIYGYSTDILGVVIEQVSGKSLREFLRSEITAPLKMIDTHFYLPTSKRDRLATVYSVRESGDLIRAPDAGGMAGQGVYVDGPRQSFSGGAGLLSTVGDYARFLQMMLNGGELDGAQLLSPNTVALMTTNHIGDLSFSRVGSGFGLGFSVVTDFGMRGIPGSNGEYGWGGAYHSVYWVDPKEELIVVYLTQVRPATGLDDHQKLRALVYQAIID